MKIDRLLCGFVITNFQLFINQIRFIKSIFGKNVSGFQPPICLANIGPHLHNATHIPISRDFLFFFFFQISSCVRQTHFSGWNYDTTGAVPAVTHLFFFF